MAKKKMVSAAEVKARNFRNSVGVAGDDKDREPPIKAAVWGQLEPLDRKAREKQERWGNRLPSLVSPDLAGRFEAAYEALGEKVSAGDVRAVNEIVGQLMRAWDVLEEAAVRAGHQPLPEHAYAIQLAEGDVVCIAMEGAPRLRQQFPEWTVYSFEDAARVLRADFTEGFLREAFNAFPQAKVTKVVRHGETIDWDLGDEIPW